jgi:dihydroorotate dehydrogenase
MDAEDAHRFAIDALRLGVTPGFGAPRDAALTVQLWGQRFPTPIGVAAGFDKNAEAPDALLRLGFGFVEVGTITPRPQAGNPRPRLFRLPEDGGVINRMGFPGEGLDAARRRLERRTRKGIVGVNIGANKDSIDPAVDYSVCAQALAPLADYIVCNVSSPNTPGLRQLQGRERLNRLLGRVRDALGGDPTPLVVKIAPDVSETDLDDIVAVSLAMKLDGLIVGNTTISRPDSLKSARKTEAGGLSGAPLATLSTTVLRQAATRLEGRLPLVGCGGVANGADAYAKIRAGATLVQLYSAMVYEGPWLGRRVAVELAALLKRDGYSSVSAAIGADLRR